MDNLLTEADLQQRLSTALNHHQAGRYDQAEALYHQILQQQPQQADALHLLGMILFSRGELDKAAGLILNAIESNPQVPAFHNNLSVIRYTQGQLDLAITLADQAIRLMPDYVDAYINKARALSAQKLTAEALQVYEKALNLAPQNATVHCHIGIMFQSLNQLDQAKMYYTNALKLNPQYVDAYNNLGTVLQQQGLNQEARACYEQALRLDPNFAGAYTNIGRIMQALGDLEEAKKFHVKALEVAPNFPEAENNLGIIFQEEGNDEEAIEHFRKALEIRPQYADAYSNLGNIALCACQIEEALDYFQKALSIQPNLVDAHWDRAIAWLLSGNYPKGWEEYEWRFRKKDYPPRTYQQPLWDGSPLNGKKILIYDEQGFGDTFQFIRFLPQVQEKGGEVIFECHHGLKEILNGIQGVDTLIERSETSQEMPDFDVHLPLMSLPRVLSLTINTIPTPIPYLQAETKKVTRWRKKLESQKGLKIGITWAGSKTNKRNFERSCSIESFKTLTKVPNVQLYSLQMEQPDGIQDTDNDDIIDLSHEISDFTDTAAILMNLDLVITVDTAVAHLAGALGRPVWLLLPFFPDWRWMLEGDNTPWYPSLRLFRQPSRGDWNSVFKKVARELKSDKEQPAKKTAKKRSSKQL